MAALPQILAPAGDLSCALAAMAAGAEAIYMGLKHFSARMQAENFSSADFSKLADLAHSENRKIYLTLNTFFKPNEAGQVSRLLKRVLLGPAPDGIIAQDLAIIDLARQAGYEGEIHFSTLAGLTHPRALLAAATLGVSRVVIPRELSIDEIRQMHDALPDGLDLETFIHGALCYCVSGRCWWSSYMGGKSGLRGRCVQPCRRMYTQGGKAGRFFSCRDLSIDVLVKTLLDMPRIAAWKIEGRKKGPHYVFHTVAAYRLLRDYPTDQAAKKQAEELLSMSLGRQVTRARFLPQHSVNPTAFGEIEDGKKQDFQTGSGLLCGKIIRENGDYVCKTRMELVNRDYLRIGYEDEPWHHTFSVGRAVPKGGSLTLKLPAHKSPKNNTPVFLIDRREAGLLKLVHEWQARFDARNPRLKSDKALASFEPVQPKPAFEARHLEVMLRGSLPRGREGKSGVKPGTVQGIWLSPKALAEVSRTLFGRISWWLPPVIWPDEEDAWLRLIHMALRNGARHFVCNAPWQAAMFDDLKGLSLGAGPFCNISNGYAVNILKRMGFSHVIVGPELGGEDYRALPGQSPLPLGLVVEGFLPVGVTRHSITPLKTDSAWFSPKREGFWTRRFGQNIWLYPVWPLNLEEHRAELETAGYSTFVSIAEFPPKSVEKSGRTSDFNWSIGVL